MSRTRVQHWACLSAAVLFGLLASLFASGQDAVSPATKSGGVSDRNTDLSARTESDPKKNDGKATSKAVPEFVTKTDAEWRKILTKVQYAVTRQKWTEPAGSGRYARGHYRGTFLCVCCSAAGVDTELFRSQHKFESGTGWPSFYQAAGDRALETAEDFDGPEARVEVMCRRCGAHLGHVFDDGPDPTGLRFCINSAAIKLKASDGESVTRQGASKTTSKSKKARAKVKAKAKSGPTVNPPATKSQDAPSASDSDRPGGSDPEPDGQRP
jgi:peptide-methionine (R)-S-oxide reductase